MTSINGTEIKVTCGDTLKTKVHMRFKLAETGKYYDYEPEDGDSVRFVLKSDFDDDEPLIEKAIPLDTLELVLTSEETKRLEPRNTPYVYDIELTATDGFVDTFINGASLYVLREVD